MKKIFKYFILFFFPIFISSCIKPDQEPDIVLPTEENTMYYYIDGQLIIPKDSSNFPYGITNDVAYSRCMDNSIEIRANKGVKIHFFEGIEEEGIRVLNQSHWDTCQVFDNHAMYTPRIHTGNDIWETQYYYTHDGTGTVEITYLSEDKKKFKGTFEMVVYLAGTGKEKHITNGHFNINLETIND